MYLLRSSNIEFELISLSTLLSNLDLVMYVPLLHYLHFQPIPNINISIWEIKSHIVLSVPTFVSDWKISVQIINFLTDSYL